MDTDISSGASTDSLAPALVQKLSLLTAGTFCFHRSWGYGQIKEVVETGDLIIDFDSKKDHIMQAQYAAESLAPLSKDHIYVQKCSDLESLQKRAQDDPISVVKQTILSLGEHATAEAIATELCPSVVALAGYKKWWDAAKRALKKDGHFYIPTRKTEALRVLDAPQALGEQAIAAFRAAIGVKQLLFALESVRRHWGEIKDDALVDEIAGVLNQAIAKVPKTHIASAIELSLARDEFLVEAGREKEKGLLSVVSQVPTTPEALSNILDDLPGLKQVKLMRSVKADLNEAWPELYLGLLSSANGRVAEVIVEAFVEEKRADEVVAAVNRLLRERSVTCDFMFWFCKSRLEIFNSLFEPHLIMAVLSVLEADQFSDYKKGTKLYELVLNDKDLISAILSRAPFEDVRDVTRAILLSPVFEELDKRSLLATIIKLFPEVQSMIVGDEKTSEDATLIVSWPSLERRKLEFEEIVNKKIPENSKEIGIARSYGDLRENHEFKAAKEMQTVLMRRKAELESMLTRAQGTDFVGVDTSVVNIGTKVTIVDNETKEKSTYTILGAWDSDPREGIISYLTPVAQALIKKPLGTSVTLPTETSGERHVTIEKIESYK
jgi:transcription elongation GreA/GreB family factor/transcription elongation factor GreA-like protein